MSALLTISALTAVLWAPQLPPDVIEYIDQAAALYGVDRDLVAAVVWVESRGDPGAVSPVGAQGLMQIMPGTAVVIASVAGIDELEIYRDPAANVAAGTWYLGRAIDDFGGDVSLGLAAYHAGAGAIIEAGYRVPAVAAGYVAWVTQVWGEMRAQNKRPVCVDRPATNAICLRP